MNYFTISPVSIQNLLEKYVPIPGIAYLYADGSVHFRLDPSSDPKHLDYVYKDSFRTWVGYAATQSVSVDDFASFLTFVAILDIKIRKPNDAGEDDMILRDLSLLSKEVMQSYSPSASGVFSIPPQSLAYQCQLVLKDFDRYAANAKKPVSEWDLTYDEQVYVASILHEKAVLNKDEQAALNSYLVNFASNGDTESMIALGDMYFGKGKNPVYGVVRSYKESLKYYLRAGECGEYLGYLYAGDIYYCNLIEDPKGPDFASAFRCYSYAADHNDLEAFCKLGDMYWNGYFVRKDEKEAVFLIQSNFGDVVRKAYYEKDTFFLGPYLLRLGRYAYAGNNRDNQAYRLGCLILGVYFFQVRDEETEDVMDEYEIEDAFSEISSLSDEMGIRPRSFTLPYAMTRDDICCWFGPHSFANYVISGSAEGKKGGKRIVLEFHLNPDSTYCLPLVSCTTPVRFTNLRIAFELDRPLKSDLPKTHFDHTKMSGLLFLSHLSVVLGEDSYQGIGLTVLGLSIGKSPIYEVGDTVLVRIKGGKKQKGTVEEALPFEGKYRIKIVSEDGTETALKSLSPRSLTPLPKDEKK